MRPVASLILLLAASHAFSKTSYDVDYTVEFLPAEDEAAVFGRERAPVHRLLRRQGHGPRRVAEVAGADVVDVDAGFTGDGEARAGAAPGEPLRPGAPALFLNICSSITFFRLDNPAGH